MSQRSYWPMLGLCLMALLLPTQARKPSRDTGGVSAAQALAFQIGFALEMPAAHTRLYLEAVKTLRTVTDDEQGSASVARLAEKSALLRSVESRSYSEAARRLQSANAPVELQHWAQQAAEQLDAPLILSKEAKTYAKSDTNMATVLGTIDESQALKVTSDNHMPSLQTWLTLTGGPAASWADEVGGLTAEMDASILNDKPLLVSQSDTLRLANAAPVGTPAAIVRVLTDLTPKRGNLAALVHILPAPVLPKSMNDPRRTLLEAFSAQELSETINKR